MARSLGEVTREVVELIERSPVPIGRTVHVYPLFGREHNVEGGVEDCWCVPETQRGANGVVVAVHQVVN